MKYKKIKRIVREICAETASCNCKCPFYAREFCIANIFVNSLAESRFKDVLREHKERKGKGEPQKGGNVAQRD
jgi:hypothetical protein